MATLTVGSGQQFSTVSAAVNASRDGDTIKVQAGTYTNDFVTVNTKVGLEGVGGMVKMVATVAPPNGKAIMTTNSDVTVDHFEFSGAKVPDGNGAGIRYQAGALTVSNSYFHDNENGLLSNAAAGGSITIKNSEFARNGVGDGYTHNLYVGIIDNLTITNSYFHDVTVGNQIKSRAYNTTITNSRIAEGENGTGSYSIDLPVGGKALVKDNVIIQGAHSQNPAIVHFGGEGAPHAGSSIEVASNLVTNNLSSPSSVLVLNQAGASASVVNNTVFGLTAGQIVSVGGAYVSGTTFLPSAPAFDLSSPWATVSTTSAAVIVPPPPPVPVQPPAAPVPVEVTVGSGPDTLTVKVSEDAYNGHAQFTLKVDDVQVGGTLTASASHALGQSDTFTLKGDWNDGSHKVSVTFLNDAWGGNAALDRNLYVDKVSFNGVDLASSSAALETPRTVDFTVPAIPISVAPSVPAPAPVQPPVTNTPAQTTVGSGPDTLTVKVSEDAYNGHAQFTLKVDDVQVGGTLTAGASHALGQSDTFTLKGDWNDGSHKVSVTFLNDAWGGSPKLDRNLYVDKIAFNGVDLASSSASLERPGTAEFTVPATGGAATSNVLTLRFSEDAYQGDAQFSVAVNGQQVGGTVTAHASHASGQAESISLTGSWGAGPQQVSINFLNDRWDGSAATDRNLYIESLTYDGQTTAGADMMGGGVVRFTVGSLAPAHDYAL